MSATLSEDVKALKRMVLHNAVSVMENTQYYKSRLICIFTKKRK